MSDRKVQDNQAEEKPQFSTTVEENPNVDFELLKEFYRLSGSSEALSKGADYRVAPPFSTVHVSDFQFVQSAFSTYKKTGT